ncbi:MAG: Hsp20/alpha crystallin family protein [Candidatus Liptonbacteria bacterium]|nr:Hsp20/alpha crystallin family protein [Candidatus Liptonbacteria bacterium]
MPMIVPRGFFDRDWSEDFWQESPLAHRAGLIPIRNFLPAVDVKEDEKAVVVEMEVPGLDPEKTSISVEGNHLKVEAIREEKKEEKNKKFFCQEIRRGSFSRLVRLPAPVDADKVEATYEKGILTVILPKVRPEQREKKVSIKVK